MGSRTIAILLTPPILLLPAIGFAAPQAFDSSSKDCAAAQSAAAKGVSSGSQSGKDSEIDDRCIAAVFDSSKVARSETNPKQNPKNYRCVGKAVKIFVNVDGAVREQWNASASVIPGTCSTAYCTAGGDCKAAQKYQGLTPYTPKESVTSRGSTQSGSQNSQNAVAPADNTLSSRLDDAFEKTNDANYEQLKNNNDLSVKTFMRADELKTMVDYENSDVPPETRQSDAYQALIFRSDNPQTLTPEQYSSEWSVTAPGAEPLDLLHLEAAPSTFADLSAPETSANDYYKGFRPSDNIEDVRFRPFRSFDDRFSSGVAQIENETEGVLMSLEGRWAPQTSELPGAFVPSDLPVGHDTFPNSISPAGPQIAENDSGYSPDAILFSPEGFDNPVDLTGGILDLNPNTMLPAPSDPNSTFPDTGGSSNQELTSWIIFDKGYDFEQEFGKFESSPQPQVEVVPVRQQDFAGTVTSWENRIANFFRRFF